MIPYNLLDSAKVMKPENSGMVEGLTLLTAARPRVIERYSGYAPPFDVARLTEKLLASVPAKYLLGLREVILTNTGDLSRKRRGSVTQSRKRKVRIIEARGLYNAAYRGQPAWIEIYVDNVLKGRGKGWWGWLLRLGGGDGTHTVHFGQIAQNRQNYEKALLG